MKRTNTWADAFTTKEAAIDLGDGLSMRLPLGNVAEVIGDAAKTAVDASPKIAQIETVTIPKALADAKEYADTKNIASDNAPLQLLGTEDLHALTNGKYRVPAGSTSVALGLPTSGHGFLRVDRNPASGRITWTAVSEDDPSEWVLTFSAGEWSAWQRTDGLKALADAKAYADTVTVDASSGPKVIAIDVDNVPYYSTTSGTHRLFPDADGVPYFSRNLWPATSTDTDGAPVITY